LVVRSRLEIWKTRHERRNDLPRQRHPRLRVLLVALPWVLTSGGAFCFMRTTYSEKLKDPRWQKRRLEKLGSAFWRCEKCSSTQVTLHIHHIKYIRGREPWEYADNELRVLCAKCHSEEHPDKPRRGVGRKLSGGFTMVANSTGRDKRLGYCARGILLMASTHSKGWQFNLKSIRANTPSEGKTAIGNAIKQLKRFGYLKIKPKHSEGRYRGAIWSWDFNPTQPVDGGAL